MDAEILRTLFSRCGRSWPGPDATSSKGSLRVVYSHAAPGTVPDIYGIVEPRSATFVLQLRHISATFYGGLLPIDRRRIAQRPSLSLAVTSIKQLLFLAWCAGGGGRGYPVMRVNLSVNRSRCHLEERSFYWIFATGNRFSN